MNLELEIQSFVDALKMETKYLFPDSTVRATGKTVSINRLDGTELEISFTSPESGNPTGTRVWCTWGKRGVGNSVCFTAGNPRLLSHLMAITFMEGKNPAEVIQNSGIHTPIADANQTMLDVTARIQNLRSKYFPRSDVRLIGNEIHVTRFGDHTEFAVITNPSPGTLKVSAWVPQKNECVHITFVVENVEIGAEVVAVDFMQGTPIKNLRGR